MIVDGADLADRAIDRADEIGFGDRACSRLQRTREELVEGSITRDVGILGFAHVDAVFAHEQADHARRRRSCLGPGNASGKGGQCLLRQQILREDFESI